ncbi:MAG TPA: efflux RND transporter periplasmic adaptor subunit [Acidobacteriota bacterium]|nr:efflux RND transporter periplasmic adaptor subunit [Acidobacteriota bacterium]
MIRTVLKITLPLLVLAAAAGGAYLLIESRPQVETRPPEVIPPLVRTLTVQPESIQFRIPSQGTVAPRTQSDLVPEISGRVVEVSANLANGAFFEENEVLLRLDPRDYELAMVRTQAEVARAESRLELERAQAEVARKEWEKLGGGEPPSPLVVREPQLAEAQANLAAAQANLSQAQRDLERTVIRAPYAGRVRSESVDQGQYVTRGSPIARIYSVDFVEIRLPVPDEQLAFMSVPIDYREDPSRRPGPRVILRADFAGRQVEWRGRIVRTEGEIDPKTRMVHLVARVDDPYGRKVPGRPPLSVGMFVEAEILGRWASDVFVLPRAALRGQDEVLVVSPEDELFFRRVGIERAEGDTVVVRSGLEAGERICLSPLDSPTDGMKVRTRDDSGRPGVGRERPVESVEASDGSHETPQASAKDAPEDVR